MVRKKITGFCQKRVQFGDFFQEISFVYRLASNPLVRMHPKKDPIESAETGQHDKPIIKFLSLRTATQL